MKLTKKQLEQKIYENEQAYQKLLREARICEKEREGEECGRAVLAIISIILGLIILCLLGK